MLKKLKLLLKNQKGLLLALALKALIFSAFLYFSFVWSHWLLAVFLGLAFYFYFQSFLNSRRFFPLFLIVLIISLLLLSLVNGRWLFLISLFSGLLFFFLLGIKDLIFVHRQQLSYFLNSLLFLAIFICFFSFGNSAAYLFLKYLAVFGAIFSLFIGPVSPLKIISPTSPVGSFNLIAAGLSFGLIQILWAISLLPFNFLNSSSLALLAALILEDFAIHRLSGTISRPLILRNITLFLILSLVIFAATKWSP